MIVLNITGLGITRFFGIKEGIGIISRSNTGSGYIFGIVKLRKLNAEQTIRLDIIQ